MNGSSDAAIGNTAAPNRRRRAKNSERPGHISSSSPYNHQLQQPSPCKLLLLHGNRQTGGLLLGRIERFSKKLYKAFQIEIVAIDAPFEHPLDNGTTRTWWHRSASSTASSSSSSSSSRSLSPTSAEQNDYIGLEESIELVESTWRSAIEPTADTDMAPAAPFVGLIGFSQGARLVHLLALRHEQQKQTGDHPPSLDGLQFVIMVAGYDAPLPPNLFSIPNITDSKLTAILSTKCTIPSLHVWGETDRLVLPLQSSDVATHYLEPTTHVHDGGHHVPMRAADVQAYLDFIGQCYVASNNNAVYNSTHAESVVERSVVPDDECAMQQHDEVSALEAIYGNDFHMLSKCFGGNEDDMTSYEYPITFRVDISPTDDDTTGTSWPSTNITIRVKFPTDYPNVAPVLSVVQHDGLPLLLHQQLASDCVDAMYDEASKEIGMPCIMSCLLAAKDYFDSPPSSAIQKDDSVQQVSDDNFCKEDELYNLDETRDEMYEHEDSNIKKATTDRIRVCNLQGLEIASTLIKHSSSLHNVSSKNGSTINDETNTGTQPLMGKGGSWMFTIGLVGKPSAGKSTFFNTATGFARQRQTAESGDTKNINVDASLPLGGAAMAPHPFTTINPNVGYCLVPAPPRSCPDDNVTTDQNKDTVIGSTHGRDHQGRRFLPVIIKDVAGLVPGAYQGRGRGNQFLNDLCDADVLIHVCDASGMADSEGNMVASSEQLETASDHMASDDSGRNSLIGCSNPLDDMAWIRNELIEWVYTNLVRKWDTIRRKGRSKLEGMFSGYGQTLAMTCNILNAVEKYMIQVDDYEQGRFLHPFEQMEEWDTGDIYRLVSAFLGVRFPIALALNKADIPSSKEHIGQIMAALPVHGTHVATPLSAKREMQFVKRHMEATRAGKVLELDENSNTVLPVGTWTCLQSAICLCDPVLVFPVVDHQSYLPLPGLFRYATSDPSLPSPGLIACLQAAGGVAPSEWDSTLRQYAVPKVNGNKKKAVTRSNVQLRDAIMMKPGSTINDLFNTLKKMGALSGEFIRAEAASDMHVLPKPVTKHQPLSPQVRIIKIMTNKRNAWQSTM